MSVDLEQSLAQLAGSVHDDAAAERMSGQVRHMVTRIRRRRAARHAGQGVVGVGAAAAVVFGGMQLTGRPTAGPPATQGPTDGTSSTAISTAVCGEAPPPPSDDPRAAAYLLNALVPREVPYGEPVPVPTSVQRTTDGSPPVTWGEATPLSLELMVLQDGLVVASTLVVFADDRPGMNPGDVLITGEQYYFSGCGGGENREPSDPGDSMLAPGDYTIVATERLLPADGEGEVAVPGGPWDLTVTDPDAAAPEGEELTGDAERAAAAAELAALLARSPSGTFPTCGSAVPADDEDAPLALDLDTGLGTAPVAPGSGIGSWVDVRTTGGREVIANVPSTGAVLVVVKDGIVVGTGSRDGEDVSHLSLGAEGSVRVALTGALSLCADPAQETPEHGLPPGTYDVYGVLDVALKEIVEADGEAVSNSDLLTVRSSAVTVTVE